MNNMQYRRLWFVLIAAAPLLLSACLNEIRVPLKTARFQLPEVSERIFASNISINQQTGSDVVIVENADQSPPNDKTSYVTSGDGIATGGDAAITILPRTEIALSYARGTYLIGGKVQVFGPAREQSTKGDLSLAVSAGYGYNQLDETDDSGRLRWKATYKVKMLDASAILGYRVGQRWLLYGGPFYQTYDVAGKLNQLNSTTGASMGEFNIDSSGHFYGFNFGFEFFLNQNRKFSLLTEGSRGTANFKNTYSNESPLNIAVAVRAFF